MTLNVPGVGPVQIRWMPASDEDYKDLGEGGRSGFQPIAFVYHRAVANTIHGIDVTFAAGDSDPATVGSPGRPVAANFGIGDTGTGGVPIISQYVRLQETAYCNGDCSQTVYGAAFPSKFDQYWGHKGHNERTVSIEHDDNGGSSNPAVKGLVTEAIIKTSIELTRLLLSGNLAAITAAGIKCDAATAAALHKIVPGPKTMLMHNDIAGKAKPFCWKPWQADKIGFPRARYIAELTAPVPAPQPPQEGDMPQLSSYLPGQIAAVKAGVNVRSAPSLTAPVLRVTAAAEAWVVTGFVKGDLDADCNSDQWICRWSGRWEYTSKCNLSAGPAPAPDATPYSKAQLDAAAATAASTAKSKTKADAKAASAAAIDAL